MPSGAMKGGSFILVTRMPLIQPQTDPVRMPKTMPIGTSMPHSLTASAATTPASASTEPTERSMPPVMMTQVAPMPRNAIEVTCSAIVMPLLTVKTALLVNEKRSEEHTYELQ